LALDHGANPVQAVLVGARHVCGRGFWIITNLLTSGAPTSDSDFRLRSSLRSSSNCDVSITQSAGRKIGDRTFSVATLSLDFAVARFLMKSFRTSNIEIITECQRYFGVSLPSELIERKINKFVNNYITMCHHFEDLLSL